MKYVCIIMLLLSLLSPIAYADLVDSTFEMSKNSADLRQDGSGQDWYDCAGDSELLSLDTTDIKGNPTSKAKFDFSDEVRLCQEFPEITGKFMAQWDIYVDYSAYPNEASAVVGYVMLGNFLEMQMYKDEDQMKIQAFNNHYEPQDIEGNIDTDKWHNIQVMGDIDEGLVDIYLDGYLIGSNIGATSPVDSIGFIRFMHTIDLLEAQKPISAYVDNVHLYGDLEFYLNITVEGTGSVFYSPDKEIYSFDEIVTLSAVPQEGWVFDSWSGDITGTDKNISININGDMDIVANFRQPVPLFTTILGILTIMIMMGILIFIRFKKTKK